MTALAVVSGRDVLDPTRMGTKLIAFAKTSPRIVVGIVNRDGATAIAIHHREARNVGWPITDVDHVLKRDRPHLRWHVIVHILIIPQHALVDPEQILGLGLSLIHI